MAFSSFMARLSVAEAALPLSSSAIISAIWSHICSTPLLRAASSALRYPAVLLSSTQQP